MSMMTGRILGVDYGRSRIGIAVSDPTAVIAQGLPTISGKTPKQAVAEIAQIGERYEVTRIVVGMPLTLRGDKREAGEAAEDFARKLKQVTAVPVTLIDERFTSVIAQRSLIAMGRSPNRNKGKIDEISAMLILQSYLDSAEHQETENESLPWKRE